MFAVGRLRQTGEDCEDIGDKVISKSRFYNTFNYLLGYEREVGDWPVVGELVFV